jgi:membrane dipeptidase
MSGLSPESARALHADGFVFDGHNDLAGPLRRGESLDDRGGRGHMDLKRMREGGLSGGIFAVFIDPAEDHALERTMDGVADLRGRLESHPEFRVVLSAGDLAMEADDERIAAVIGVEGGYAIEDDLGVVDALFDAGVRCLTLTWNDPTTWADAAGNEAHGGLTSFGARLVDHLFRLGVLVDLSHASDRTFDAVLERAERPVVSSHTGMRRLAALPRNIGDRHLEGIAGTGGLAGVSLFNGHLDADFEERCAPLRAREYDDMEEMARAVLTEVGTLPMSAVVDHVRHAVRVVGPDHIGLGADFDGMWALPEGLSDVSRLPELSVALADVFDAAGLTAFLGANWRRVLRASLP